MSELRADEESEVARKKQSLAVSLSSSQANMKTQILKAQQDSYVRQRMTISRMMDGKLPCGYHELSLLLRGLWDTERRIARMGGTLPEVESA